MLHIRIYRILALVLILLAASAGIGLQIRNYNHDRAVRIQRFRAAAGKAIAEARWQCSRRTDAQHP